MLALSHPADSTPSAASANMLETTRVVLSNGLIVLIQRNPGAPTVSIRGQVRIGAIHEPADRAGLAVLTGSSLIRGTERRSFQQMVSELEERACSVGASGGLHQTSFSGRALAEDLPLILDMLADMLLRPTFPPQEVERYRRQFLMSLRENEEDPHVQASRAMRALLYPPEHPYSRLPGGTPETIQAITREDMVAFHQRYHPAATIIAIVGDIVPTAVVAELERCFGAWEPAHAPPALDVPTVPALAGVQRRDIAMVGKVQSDIIWGVHSTRRNDPDYYALMLANMVLGRFGMGGRLGERVREEQGMAYYVYSSFDADIIAGPWVAVAGVNPANVEPAIAALLQEIERFRAEGPTPEELADVRAYLTGSLALGLESNSGIAATLVAIERFDLGLDYIARYPTIINGISQAEIVAAAQKYLSTSDYVLATAGPPAA